MSPGAQTRAGGLGRQGLRFRVYLLIAIGVLVPSALVGSLAWWHLSELDHELLAARRGATIAVAEHVDEEITGDLEALQRLASAPAVTGGGSQEAVDALLRATYLHAQFLGGLFLLDREGRVLIEEPRGGRSVAPPWNLPEVQATLRDGKPRVTSLEGAHDEERTYALVSVVDWRGKPMGVVGAVIDPGQPARARVLRHLIRRAGGHASIVDANGTVLASTERGQVHQAISCRARTARLVRAKETSIGLCRDCHATAVPWIMAVAPLSAAPWAVVTIQPEEAVLATARGISGRLILLAVGLLIMAGTFAWGAVRSVTRPVAVLTASAERIAAGGMDEPIPELGADELGRLGRSVERMRSSLREMIAYVARANEALEQRVAERTRELASANAQLRERDAQRQRLLRTVITAQEDERKRIARELHDETTQSLAALAMGIEAAGSAIRSGGPRPRLDEVKTLAVRTLEEVHRLILDLRPAVLDDLGLSSALRWYAERCLTSRGIAVRCEIAEMGRRLPTEIEVALFRMAQEVMNNIARHAEAESVLIQMEQSGRELRIEIEDDGKGFAPGTAPTDRPHYGLLGLQERADLLGGKLTVDSAPGRGTRIEIVVPLPPDEASPEAPAPISSEAP